MELHLRVRLSVGHDLECFILDELICLRHILGQVGPTLLVNFTVEVLLHNQGRSLVLMAANYLLLLPTCGGLGLEGTYVVVEVARVGHTDSIPYHQLLLVADALSVLRKGFHTTVVLNCLRLGGTVLFRSR